MVSLNPNIQRLRQRIRLESGGDGDHSRTLMETLSNPFLVDESVINRLLGVSLAFLIIFMLSHQLVLAHYLYEFAKPVYVVYASATVLVDLVAPALRRMERWLVADQVDGFRSVDNINDMFFDELMDSFSEAEDEQEQNDNNNVFRTGRSTDANSNRPRATSGSNGRQLRSRGRTGETRPMILKAIESELKKGKRT